MRGLSLVAASGGHSSLQCAGLSLSRPLLLRSTGSRRPGSVVVAHGPSCSAVCGIFPDQGSNPCPLHWQADSQPLRHQGSPVRTFKINSFSNFQLFNTVLLTIVTMLYITSLWLIYFITRSLYILTTVTHFAHTPPLSQLVLRICLSSAILFWDPRFLKV